MHVVYKAISEKDVQRILDICRNHSIARGGPFELYPADNQGDLVIVNAKNPDGSKDNLRPLGSFYCNYLGPGIISLDERDPDHDSVSGSALHTQAVKQVIDSLLGEDPLAAAMDYWALLPDQNSSGSDGEGFS